ASLFIQREVVGRQYPETIDYRSEPVPPPNGASRHAANGATPTNTSNPMDQNVEELIIELYEKACASKASMIEWLRSRPDVWSDRFVKSIQDQDESGWVSSGLR